MVQRHQPTTRDSNPELEGPVTIPAPPPSGAYATVPPVRLSPSTLPPGRSGLRRALEWSAEAVAEPELDGVVSRDTLPSPPPDAEASELDRGGDDAPADE